MLFLGKNKDQFTLTTTTRHQALHTTANTIVRGVLFDQSTAKLDGMIKIDPDAQQTNSFLDQNIILVGDKARADAQPMLEIEANDVKASHAATVGKLEEDQLFYLMSRGISHQQAIQTLVAGFLQPVLDMIKDKQQQKAIANQLFTHEPKVRNA